MRALLCLVTVIAIVATARDALACACCDGNTAISAVGWSAKGDRVLIRNVTWEGCEVQRSHRVLRVGHTVAKVCYDLHGKTRTPVKCSKLGFGEGRKPSKAVPKAFAKKARPLAADRVRAHAVRTKDEDVWRVVIEVFAAATWTQIDSQIARRAIHGEADDSRGAPHTVSIYPAPNGRDALLLVSGLHAPTGNGHFDTSIKWIKLPSVEATKGPVTKVPATKGPATKGPATKGPATKGPATKGPATKTTAKAPLGRQVRQAVPEFARALDRERRARGRTYNGMGLVAHRAGRYQDAAGEFIDALYEDPSNVMARYNYACALNRLGLAERALAQLATIAGAGCKKCPARLVRAAVDEDLATLRSDKRFVALIKSAQPPPSAPSTP